MELFLQLACTITLSLLCSFLLAKLFSVASATDHHSMSRSNAVVIEKDCDSGLETEYNKVGESEGRMVWGKLGSARTRGDEEIGESGVSKEVVISGMREKSGEECGEELDGCEPNVIDESPERVEVCEIETELGQGEVLDGEEIETKTIRGEEIDDWEGIERTELEMNFGAAVVFVGSGDNAHQLSNLNSDVKMQLYGLHKIATEGQCREAQPMALKVSARAKWNVWQQLGNMSPEVAMEQYITLLSKSIPSWIKANCGDTQ